MYFLQSPRNEVTRLHLELAPLPADDERDVRVGARGQQERERGARRTQGVLKERDKGPTAERRCSQKREGGAQPSNKY